MQHIFEPHEHDILGGRGNGPNLHLGNIYFRELVEANKTKYTSSQCNKVKNSIILEIVNKIQSRTPPGRFLTKDNDSGLWYVMAYKKMLKKTGQALRERPVSNSSLASSVYDISQETAADLNNLLENLNCSKVLNDNITKDGCDAMSQKYLIRQEEKEKFSTNTSDDIEYKENHYWKKLSNKNQINNGYGDCSMKQKQEEVLDNPCKASDTYISNDKEYGESFNCNKEGDTNQNLSEYKLKSDAFTEQDNFPDEPYGTFNSSDTERRESMDWGTVLNATENNDPSSQNTMNQSLATLNVLESMMTSMKSINLDDSEEKESDSVDQMDVSMHFANCAEFNKGLSKSVPPCLNLYKDDICPKENSDMTKSTPPLHSYNLNDDNVDPRQMTLPSSRRISLKKFFTLSGRKLAAFTTDDKKIQRLPSLQQEQARSDYDHLFEGSYSDSMDFNDSIDMINFAKV